MRSYQKMAPCLIWTYPLCTSPNRQTLNDSFTNGIPFCSLQNRRDLWVFIPPVCWKHWIDGWQSHSSHSSIFIQNIDPGNFQHHIGCIKIPKKEWMIPIPHIPHPHPPLIEAPAWHPGFSQRFDAAWPAWPGGSARPAGTRAVPSAWNLCAPGRPGRPRRRPCSWAELRIARGLLMAL